MRRRDIAYLVDPNELRQDPQLVKLTRASTLTKLSPGSFGLRVYPDVDFQEARRRVMPRYREEVAW